MATGVLFGPQRGTLTFGSRKFLMRSSLGGATDTVFFAVNVVTFGACLAATFRVVAR